MKARQIPTADELFETVKQLQHLLNENHPEAQTTHYVNDYLPILAENKQRNDFVFLGKLHYFAMTVPNYVEEENLSFTSEELARWEKINSAFNEKSDPYGLPLLEICILKILGLV